MASPAGVGSKTRVGRNVGKSKGGKDKGVKGEGSSFWMKLWMLFSCMAWGSKAEHCSSGDTGSNNKQDKGKKPIRDISKAPVVAEASSSNNNNQETSGSTPHLIMELQQYSHLRQFTFHELKLATKNFKAGNFLGEGGFGTVHKGWITQNGCSPSRPGVGIPVAVKTLNIEGNQGHKEWVAEVSNLGAMEHPNLVKLVGYCIEGDNRVLVYEFMPRGSLEHHLFRRGALPLPWSIRLKILIGAAKGLTFLHEEATKPLIYRDFKTSNILLDSDYSAKLSDFGLVKDAPVDGLTHVSTIVMGTQGYAAPEYVMTGQLSLKSDVYSFGVVLLEVMTGRKAMDKKRPVAEHHLVEWARPQIKPGSGAQYHQVMDPKLDDHYSTKGARRAMRLAYQCLLRDAKSRPLMSQVVEGLHCASQYTNLACASPFYHHIMKQGQGQCAPSSSNSKPASANNIATNKYGLIIGPSAGSTPSRFQASPLSFTHPFPSPQPSADAG